jgi:hypothetical protein
LLSTDEWIAALIERHTASLTRPEFLKSIRALSARYVERRSALDERSALDSAGKRSAFAAFYAPLHFLTMREIVRELGVGSHTPVKTIDTIVDLGCGTGVAGAALALAYAKAPRIEGVDLHPWAVDEARGTWRTLGLSGSARRGPLEQRLSALAASRGALDTTAIVCGWSLNELPHQKRTLAIDALLGLPSRGAAVLIVEPIARRLVPWWDGFAMRAVAAGGRSDEWRFPLALPPALADLDEAAGFDREALSARSVSFHFR